MKKMYILAGLCILVLFGCNQPDKGDTLTDTSVELFFQETLAETEPGHEDAMGEDFSHDNVAVNAGLLEEFITGFDKDEIIFCDTYENEYLYAIVLRQLRGYEKRGRFLDETYYYVIDIGFYDVNRGKWKKNMLDSIILEEFWQTDIEVNKPEQGIYEFICTDKFYYTLEFGENVFSLSRNDISSRHGQNIPELDNCLLLGIENANSLMSYFIYEEDNQLNVVEKSDTIIVPMEDDFYHLNRFRYYVAALALENPQSYTYGYLLRVNYADYFSYKAGINPFQAAAERAAEYDAYFDHYGYDSSRDYVYFIANGFISFWNSYYWDGGGTGRSTTPAAFFYAVDEINEQRLKVVDEGQRALKTGQSLIEKLPQYETVIQRKLAGIQQHYDALNETLIEEGYYDDRGLQTYYVADDNLMLAHENGMLKVKLAIPKYSYAPNYSPHGYYADFIDLEIDITDGLALEETLWVTFDEVKDRIEDAIDIFTSPDGKILVVESVTDISIFIRENQDMPFFYSTPVYSLSKNDGDHIVMAEWAEGEQVKQWQEVIPDMETCSIYYFKP